MDPYLYADYAITWPPVVIPLGLVAFAGMLWSLHRRGTLTFLRATVAAAVCVYVGGIVANILFPMLFGTGDDGSTPWYWGLTLVPFVDAEPAGMIKNVLVFLPLGVLAPLVLGSRSVLHVLLTGFLLSLSMEVVQVVTNVLGDSGHIADVNDLIANTVGAPLGYGVFRLLLLVPALRRLADAATFPPRRGATPGNVYASGEVTLSEQS